MRFAQEGVKVLITGRRLKPLEETVDYIESVGGTGTFLSVDVSEADQVQHMVDEIVRRYGKLDFLLNNAGIFTGIGKNHTESN